MIVWLRVWLTHTRVRAMEDQTVQRLSSSGVQASAACLALPQMPMEASDFREQAKSAGFAAVVLYAPGSSYTGSANRPGLGAGVGIGPVGVGVGPLIGGSKSEERRNINVQILPTASAQPVWSAVRCEPVGRNPQGNGGCAPAGGGSDEDGSRVVSECTVLPMS